MVPDARAFRHDTLDHAVISPTSRSPQIMCPPHAVPGGVPAADCTRIDGFRHLRVGGPRHSLLTSHGPLGLRSARGPAGVAAAAAHGWQERPSLLPAAPPERARAAAPRV